MIYQIIQKNIFLIYMFDIEKDLRELYELCASDGKISNEETAVVYADRKLQWVEFIKNKNNYLSDQIVWLHGLFIKKFLEKMLVKPYTRKMILDKLFIGAYRRYSPFVKRHIIIALENTNFDVWILTTLLTRREDFRKTYTSNDSLLCEFILDRIFKTEAKNSNVWLMYFKIKQNMILYPGDYYIINRWVEDSKTAWEKYKYILSFMFMIIVLIIFGSMLQTKNIMTANCNKLSEEQVLFIFYGYANKVLYIPFHHYWNSNQ